MSRLLREELLRDLDVFDVPEYISIEPVRVVNNDN